MDTPKELIISLQKRGLKIKEIALLLEVPENTVKGWRYGNKTTTQKRFIELKAKVKLFT